VEEFVRDVSLSKVRTAGNVMVPADNLLYGWMGPETASHILRNLKRDYAFVVSVGGKYLGLITMEALKELRRIHPEKKIKDFLLQDIPAAHPDSKVEELILPATESPYPIPVIDDNGELIGEISNELLLSSMTRCRTEQAEEAGNDDLPGDAPEKAGADLPQGDDDKAAGADSSGDISKPLGIEPKEAD
jgi:glycine betaine/proline transport system ATP-binding protein